MAVYKKLSLAAGGGIVSALQQAKQVEGTASLCIGLGGTGIDCIRTIKTQVHRRLRPDDPEAAVPTYNHIRFLGVDSDNTSMGSQKSFTGTLSLDEEEFFSIANPNIDSMLKDPAVLRRKEFGWLRDPGNIVPYSLGDDPLRRRGCTYAIRQRGRFMMMDRANAFMNRVESELKAAREGLTDRTVNVHIFAGLSGGTGAGTFLDVCYMVREVARAYGANIYGYFFLPDVNASRIPLDNTYVHAYLPTNGYAALQELDYCMQLHVNGGAFAQEYKGGRRIDWNMAPVDMCHLICATNEDGHVLSNPYDYAMSATAEYVMDFLTNSSDENFKLTSHLANFKSAVGKANPPFGACMSYLALGASCASIPMREINTYLASELFRGFSAVRGKAPGEADVDALAAAALGAADGHADTVYESLLREVRKGAEGDFAAFRGDWKMVAEQGNKQLVRNYSDQRASQKGTITQNAQSMASGTNASSLLVRADRALSAAVRDVARGPMWAHRALDAAASHNLINVVDGLIAQNAERRNHEAYQEDLRKQDYENAKADFEAHQHNLTGMGNKRRFETYEWYLRQLNAHWLDLDAYDALDGVLRTLRRQLRARDESHYAKLASIMGNLADTFEENRGALQSQDTVLEATGGFEEPLMSIAELRDALDEEVRRVDVPNMLDAFMATFLDNEGEWASEDEARIARLVNDFFVRRAFQGFAGRTITRFLQDKYGTTTDAELADRVYREWMRRLTAKASPLFHFDPALWDQSKTSRMAFVSVPEAAGPISAAARRMQSTNPLWQVKESDLTDRIYVMCSAAVLPLASYTKCAEYERAYYADYSEWARHYYEGDIEGMPFSDWRRLPSLTPQSFIDTSRVPAALAEQVEEERALFEDAVSLGVLAADGAISVPEEGSLGEARRAIAEAREFAAAMSSRAQKPRAEELLAALEERGSVRLVPSGRGVLMDGGEDFARRNLEDHFVSSPALHGLVRDAVAAAKPVAEEADAARKALEDAIRRVDNPDMDNFCDALFSGVIALKGYDAYFEHDVNGGAEIVPLVSRNRETYPYCSIPPYQAFLSYRALPQEEKDDIAERAVERLENSPDEVAELARTLVAEMGEGRIRGWAGHARNQANRSEITAFIGDLKQRFADHCLDFGVEQR